MYNTILKRGRFDETLEYRRKNSDSLIGMDLLLTLYQPSGWVGGTARPVSTGP